MGACCSEVEAAPGSAAAKTMPAPLPVASPYRMEDPIETKSVAPAVQEAMDQTDAGDVEVPEMVDDSVTSKEQRQQAKEVVKSFVKDMVKGRKMNVMTQAGQLKTCVVSLSRQLDTLKIKVGTQTRSIPLRDIDEIAAGSDVEGIATPLDDLCATLILSDDCITFRFVDLNGRDTFVMCLLMFCNGQK